jgi:predicted ATP-grasp superfamily ATP-dependent carboligase
VLPFDLTPKPADVGIHGKAIVFAREDIVVGDTQGWLADPNVRDVPREGERITSGQPICTVFASGSDDTDCHERLVERAERVYAELSG